MIQIDLENILPEQDLSGRLKEIIDKAHRGDLFIVTKDGRPAVAVMSVDQLEDLSGRKVVTPPLEGHKPKKGKVAMVETPPPAAPLQPVPPPPAPTPLTPAAPPPAPAPSTPPPLPAVPPPPPPPPPPAPVTPPQPPAKNVPTPTTSIQRDLTPGKTPPVENPPSQAAAPTPTAPAKPSAPPEPPLDELPL